MSKKIVDFDGHKVELSRNDYGDFVVKELDDLAPGQYSALDLSQQGGYSLVGRKVLIEATISNIDSEDDDTPIRICFDEDRGSWLSGNCNLTLLEE